LVGWCACVHVCVHVCVCGVKGRVVRRPQAAPTPVACVCSGAMRRRGSAQARSPCLDRHASWRGAQRERGAHADADGLRHRHRRGRLRARDRPDRLVFGGARDTRSTVDSCSWRALERHTASGAHAAVRCAALRRVRQRPRTQLCLDVEGW
jgi:hypothetical protein